MCKATNKVSKTVYKHLLCASLKRAHKGYNSSQLNIHIIKKYIIVISQSELYPKIITKMLNESLTVAISHNEVY